MGAQKEKKPRERKRGAEEQTPKSPDEGSAPTKKRQKAPPAPEGKKAQDEVQIPRLDPKSVGYFRRVGETLQQPFESDEEKGIFIRNVFHEVQGNELALATDMSGSLVLQKLLAVATSVQLCRVLSVLSKQWRAVCCHRSGAHVIQTALLQFPRLQKQQGAEEEEEIEEEGESEPIRTLEDLFLSLGSELKEKFLLYNKDTHGSFIVRTLFQVLGGTVLSQNTGRKAAKGPTVKSEFEVPESFLHQLQELCGGFSEHIGVFATHKVASLGIQVALQVLQRKMPAVCAQLCDQMIEFLASRNVSAESSSLLVFLKDETSSRLLERILEVSEKKQLRRLFKAHFQGQLQALSSHPIANYTVQRLLSAVQTKKLAFHCAAPLSRQVACIPLFLSLLTYEVYYNKEEEEEPTEHQDDGDRKLDNVNYHGSLIVQHLLHFEDPSVILKSLGTLADVDLLTVVCSQAGCHVLDALLSSSTISDKQRKKILRRLRGHCMQLACNKYGSRVLDRMWTTSTIGVKEEIAQKLVEKLHQLQNDPIGHHIARNFALTHFVKRRKDWEEHQLGENKRRKMFSEILED
ncbi:uncharacterized protein LOC379727 isoform X1 [Xenopus laevis]|uniref:Uncharacterized protein LOC379727 isoform X1 n=1 Tax=Xenopus laevis TaxID=8355 RepID=A0A8J1LE79_XENLA|nr:uncharacterized protein LOC379727 isoform X1 [Xenopus laevis]